MQTSGSWHASRASEFYGRPAGVLHRISRAYRREQYGACRRTRHWRRIRQSGATAPRIGDFDRASCLLHFVSHWIRRTQGGCLGCVDVLGAGSRRCCPTDRCTGALEAGETETAEPGGSPTGESDRSAQRRRCSNSPRFLHPSALSRFSAKRRRIEPMTDCKPYMGATSRAARIIPGNSTLTTATTAKSSSAMMITTLSPKLVPMTSPLFATNSLANGAPAPW